MFVKFPEITNSNLTSYKYIMTDGAIVVFLSSRIPTFPVDFLKIFFQKKPCPDNYERNKKRISQIGRVVSEISWRFRV